MPIVALQNVPDAVALENVRINAARDLPWVSPADPHDGHAVLVGGGPSAEDCLPEIRWRQNDGQKLFALNGVAEWLRGRHVYADYGVILDARPENARFVTHAAWEWLLASQCHPLVFEKYAAKWSAKVWHFAVDGIEDFLPADRAATLVGGGITSGLTAMALAYMMGFRKLHLYGYDSSDRADAGHAYSQTENDAEQLRVDVTVNGRTFRAGVAMYAQAEAFEAWARQLAEAGALITVHGDGLLPAIAHAMQGTTLVEGIAA